MHKSLQPEKCSNQGSRGMDMSPAEPLGTQLHGHHPSGWGFTAVCPAQGHRGKLYWGKTKDVRLQGALPHSKGSLSHSHQALQLAIEPSDYVIHISHQLFASLLSFFPAGQNNYLMSMQRHNEICKTIEWWIVILKAQVLCYSAQK